jgi:hypothetical protein
MRAFALAAACLLGACSANTLVRFDGTGGAPAVGGSVSGGSVELDVRAGAAAAALLALGAVAAALHGAPAGAPLQDATRRDHVQDCTRPIEDSGANLSCR